MKIGVIAKNERPFPPHTSNEDLRVHGHGSGRRTTYNNSAALELSLAQMWRQVYEYPKSNSFFNLNTHGSIREHTPSSDDCLRQEEWNSANPQKQHVPLFEFFNIHSQSNQSNVSALSSSYHLSQAPQPIQSSQIVPMPSFTVDCHPPESFMGAFSHLQPEFGCFDLNISVPKRSEYTPFSNLIAMSRYTHSQQLQNPYENDSRLLHDLTPSAKDNSKDRYYFEIESVQSQEQAEENRESLLRQEKELKHLEQLQASKIEPKEDLAIDQSILWNYDTLFQSRQNFRSKDPAWQLHPYHQSSLPSSSHVFQAYLPANLATLHSMQLALNLVQDTKKVLSDHELMVEISKMLQNVECELFTLDYTRMQWSLDLGKHRLQTSLRGSLKLRLEAVFKIADSRSRIDAALTYIRQRPFRKIYFQLGSQLTQVLIVFEQLVLEFIEECSLIEFLLSLEKLSTQLSLLYNLLLNHDYIEEEQKSYECFDYRFLNSEFVIFKQVVKLSRFSDSLALQSKPLIVKLLSAVFKPLLTVLNTLLFDQAIAIQLNDQVYLKYYFDNIRDILSYVGRKIALIKEENNELYLICRMRQRLQIVGNLTALEGYEQRWRGIFRRKGRLMQRIRRQWRRRVRAQQQKRYEERMQFVYELKNKMYLQAEEENVRTRLGNERNRLELERLKSEIEGKQKRRKLLEEIQKEKERGLLIDLELREKQGLAREKERLRQQLEGIRGEVGTQPISQQNLSDVIGKAGDRSQNKGVQQQRMEDQDEEMVQQSVEQGPIKQQFSVQPENILTLPQNKQTASLIARHPSQQPNNPQNSQSKDQTQSYFPILPQKQPSPADNSSQSDSPDQPPPPLSPTLNHEVNTSTCLEICLDSIIRQQLTIIQSSLRFLVIEKYELLEIINFLRLTFLSGNGERTQEFIRVSIDAHSQLKLKYFSECLLFDTASQAIPKLTPSFYHTRSSDNFNSQISIFEDGIEHHIGFEFKTLPIILQPYLSYIHLSKYIQIFSFIIRLRYCESLVSSSWKSLNNYKKQLQNRPHSQFQLRLLNKLYVIRFIIQNFVTTFENYLFFRVIEKECKGMRQRTEELNEFEQTHLRMLDNIIRYGFIDNPHQNISKRFRQLLGFVRDFMNIVNMLVADDLPRYMHEEVERKIEFIHLTFRKEQTNIENLLFRGQ